MKHFLRSLVLALPLAAALLSPLSLSAQKAQDRPGFVYSALTFEEYYDATVNERGKLHFKIPYAWGRTNINDGHFMYPYEQAVLLGFLALTLLLTATSSKQQCRK